MDLIADTTLLVGLWRRQEWACAYASANADQSLGLPWIVIGEFRHGSMRAGHDREMVDKFLATGIPLYDTEAAIDSYAKVCSRLQEAGSYRLIGQNDLWIAAVAIAHDRRLVSRNRRHFDKIDGLQLEVLGEA